jgi:hypothetical protein
MLGPRGEKTYSTGKKNPAWEAGYTGYCCCRVFGSYFNGEAVLDYYFYIFAFFLLMIFILLLRFCIFWLRCLCTDVEYAIACKNHFFVRNIYIAKAVPAQEISFKTCDYFI